MGAACYTLLAAQPELPPLDATLGPAAAALLGGPPLALALAKLALGDLFHVELHRGRLYVLAGVPSAGPPLAPGAVAVRPTGDARGNGAFAAQPIPKGTYLGDYTGDLLDRAAFYARYPSGVVSTPAGLAETASPRAWRLIARRSCCLRGERVRLLQQPHFCLPSALFTTPGRLRSGGG